MTGAARREAIVAAALELLGEAGTPGVSTPALARRVGVTQSAIFKHFRNKEAIWRAVMDSIGAEIGERIGRALQAPGSRAEKLLGIVLAYLDAARDSPAAHALIFSSEVHSDGAASFIGAELADRFRRFHGVLLEQVRLGRDAGEFRADLDVEAAAVLVGGIAYSLLLRSRVAGPGFDAEAEARRAFPVLLEGWRPVRRN